MGRSTGWAVGLLGIVVACSSTGSTSTGGDSGAGDSGEADSGNSDGGNGPGCPTAAPSSGEPCALGNGTSCHYGGPSGIVTEAVSDGSSCSVSKAAIDCANNDAGPGDTGASDVSSDAGSVACGTLVDGGVGQQPGYCTGTMTCCPGGAPGSYYCTNTDGGSCPLVP
jgi:hypothetical protein